MVLLIFKLTVVLDCFNFNFPKLSKIHEKRPCVKLNPMEETFKNILFAFQLFLMVFLHWVSEVDLYKGRILFCYLFSL